jgi:hypothetical protein
MPCDWYSRPKLRDPLASLRFAERPLGVGEVEPAETLVTYFVEYLGTNLLKVGQTTYFKDRFAQLKTASPVEPNVLYVFKGEQQEKAFHKRFEHLRHHGEFYHLTAEVRAFLISAEMADIG